MSLLFLQQFRFLTKTIVVGTQTKNRTIAPTTVIVGFNPAKTREIYIFVNIIRHMYQRNNGTQFSKKAKCIAFTCRFLLRSLFSGGGNTGNSPLLTILS